MIFPSWCLQIYVPGEPCSLLPASFPEERREASVVEGQCSRQLIKNIWERNYGPDIRSSTPFRARAPPTSCTPTFSPSMDWVLVSLSLGLGKSMIPRMLTLVPATLYAMGRMVCVSSPLLIANRCLIFPWSRNALPPRAY